MIAWHCLLSIELQITVYEIYIICFFVFCLSILFPFLRLTIKAGCPMRLEKFPMDTQQCPLKLGSCKLNDLDMLGIIPKVFISPAPPLSHHITRKKNVPCLLSQTHFYPSVLHDLLRYSSTLQSATQAVTLSTSGTR